MSVPFSNTHLRVPRGFCTILEGLAREVLRDQPDDIPSYAAGYFGALLKEREESGMDPAEWAAKLEDRFYNNKAFKASPAKDPATEMTNSSTSSEEKSSESQTEDEAPHPEETTSSRSTSNQNSSEDTQGTEKNGNEQKDDVTEKDAVSAEVDLSKEESDNRPDTDASADELSGTEDEKDQTIPVSDQVDRAANENDGRTAADKDICQSELESSDLPSFIGISNVDVCAEDLGKEEDEGEEGQISQKQETDVGDEEIEGLAEEKQSTELEGMEEDVPYSGLADVEVCAQELGTSEEAVVGDHDDDPGDAHTTEQESSALQMEETIERLSTSQSERPEAKLQELTDQAEEQLEEEEEREETGPCTGKTNENVTTTDDLPEYVPEMEDVSDSNVAPKGETLVEISFEDVPQVQGIIENEEKKPVEESLVEASRTEDIEEQPHEVSEGLTELETGDSIHNTQEEPPSEMDRAEKEVTVEIGAAERMSQQVAHEDIDQEKVDTDDSSDSGDDDDDEEEEEEMSKGLKKVHISTSHQPAAETEGEKLEDETDGNEDLHVEETSEITTHQNEGSEIKAEVEKSKHETNYPHVKDEDKTEIGAIHIKDIQTQSLGEVEENLAHEVDDGNAEVNVLQVTQSYVSEPEEEAETETVETNAEVLPEEGEGRERTPVELPVQPEDRLGQAESRSQQQVPEAEEWVEGEKIDSATLENAVGEEGRISPTHTEERTDDDNQEEHRPQGSEKDGAEPGGKIDDKQEECSRPQEEEEDIMDIPLDDPEANKAAAKIQAGFRGHMTRKKMKPEDKAEGEEVSSTGEALNGSQGDTETGGSGAVERDDTSVPEQ